MRCFPRRFFGIRAFPGKVDTGFPSGNATVIESRAPSGIDQTISMVNLSECALSRGYDRFFATSCCRNVTYCTYANSVNVPMSFADACLVRMTETLNDPTLLTTDSDFHIYRRHSRQVIPCVLPR